MKLKSFTLTITALFFSFFMQQTIAQETTPQDTLTGAVQKLHTALELLKRIQVSGYIQPQFQYIDSLGGSTFAGGNFNVNSDKRFMLRRGRVKVAYVTDLTQFVFQMDATEKGFAIKDLYAKFTEPWLKAFSLTVGNMNRPFGYEIGYSSSNRESPERGRMSQIIFPGERDLGAMITFQMPKTSKLNFLKVEGGMFNGTGTTDFDVQKDFIGRIRMDRSTKKENIQYGLGFSYYNGGWRQGTSKVYSMADDSLGLQAFMMKKDTVNYGAISKRQYLGVDAQFNIDWVGGLTTIRGEYIWGQQPATSSSTASPSVQPIGSPVSTANLTTGAVTTTIPFSDTYIRQFNGAYFYFLQNIMQSKHQFVFKYDWYDPNTNVKGNEIGTKVNAPSGKTFKTTGANDLKYSTIGIGWIYHWDTNVKIMAYYDIVRNETSNNLALWSKDRKDNVFTLRVQYKF